MRLATRLPAYKLQNKSLEFPLKRFAINNITSQTLAHDVISRKLYTKNVNSLSLLPLKQQRKRSFSGHLSKLVIMTLSVFKQLMKTRLCWQFGLLNLMTISYCESFQTQIELRCAKKTAQIFNYLKALKFNRNCSELPWKIV
jgi:hypothetical protein